MLGGLHIKGRIVTPETAVLVTTEENHPNLGLLVILIFHALF